MKAIVVEIRQEAPPLAKIGKYKVSDPVIWDFKDPYSVVEVLKEIFTKCLDLAHLRELSTRLQTKGRDDGKFVAFRLELTIVSVKGAGKDEVGIRRLADQLGNHLTTSMVNQLIRSLHDHLVSRYRGASNPLQSF